MLDLKTFTGDFTIITIMHTLSLAQSIQDTMNLEYRVTQLHNDAGTLHTDSFELQRRIQDTEMQLQSKQDQANRDSTNVQTVGLFSMETRKPNVYMTVHCWICMKRYFLPPWCTKLKAR